MTKHLSRLATVLAAVGFTTSGWTQQNTFFVSRPNYQEVVLTQAIGSDFKIGSGINMSDPLFPVAAPMYAFKAGSSKTSPALLSAPITNDDVINNTTTSFFETTSDRQEAETIAAYFSASYQGMASGEAAYNYSRDRRLTHRAVYAIVQDTATQDPLVGNLEWRVPPNSESPLVNDADRLNQFVGLYGSHYISYVVYGYRVAIRGEVSTDDLKTVESFSAAFKAKFGSSGGSGSISKTEELILKTKSTDLRAVVTAGSITPAYSTILTSYDEIVQFLTQLRSGNIRLTRAPVYANLNSYWPTLVSFPKTRALLAPVAGIKATAPFGVPAGTIIAWSPRNDQQWKDNGAVKFAVPEGWAVCDGSLGTPDLREKFIRGTALPDDVGKPGGSSTHAHSATIFGSSFEARNARESDTAAWRRDGQVITVKPSENLPPYLTLVYLIKL